MQISTKFTIAIHLLTAVEYFSKDYKVTSEFLAGSVGSNPVIIRNIMSQLREAGLISSQRGKTGISITRPLDEITFLDIYRAVETGSAKDLFHFHEHPSPECPVGRNIHKTLGSVLKEIQEKMENEMSHHTVGEVYHSTVDAIKAQTPDPEKSDSE
jgi:DNA-binding IscR family transcriptional regulator